MMNKDISSHRQPFKNNESSLLKINRELFVPSYNSVHQTMSLIRGNDEENEWTQFYFVKNELTLKLIYDYNWFREGHNTTQLLIHFIDKIYNALYKPLSEYTLTKASETCMLS